jgi:DNA-binding NarL/FixJ family response regulator
MSIRVVIADDQAVVRSGFRSTLEDEPDVEVVGDAEDGLGAVEVARGRRADVVLMDIRMPGLDRLEATRCLAGPGVEHPIDVIVVTTFDLDDYVFGALRAGASGFLLKDASPETLLAAIRAVANGQGLIAPEVTRRLIARFAATAPDPARKEDLERLSEREREVLLEVAHGRSNGQIARRLFIEEATVKSHVSSILFKARPPQPRPGRDPCLRNRSRVTRSPGGDLSLLKRGQPRLGTFGMLRRHGLKSVGTTRQTYRSQAKSGSKSANGSGDPNLSRARRSLGAAEREPGLSPNGSHMVRAQVVAEEIFGLVKDRRSRLPGERVPDGSAPTGEDVMANRDSGRLDGRLLIEPQPCVDGVHWQRRVAGHAAGSGHREVNRVVTHAIGVKPEVHEPRSDL